MYQRASNPPLRKPTSSYSASRNQPPKDPRQRSTIIETPQSQLHTSSSSRNISSATTPYNNTKIKGPQQLLESYYVQHTKGQTSSRQSATPTNNQMLSSSAAYAFTEGDESRGIMFNNSGRSFFKTRPNLEPEVHHHSMISRRTETSPNRNRENSVNNRSMNHLDNSKIRKTLTKEMRISLATYAIEKIVLKFLKRKVISKLDKFKGHSQVSQKFKQHFMGLNMDRVELERKTHSPFERKDKPSVRDFSMNLEKEQNLAELSYSTRMRDLNKRPPSPLEALMKNGSHTARAISSSNRNISYENLNSARSHKPDYNPPRTTIHNPGSVSVGVRSESSSRGEKTLPVKKVEDPKAQRRDRAFKIIEKAIVTIQRAYRRHLRKKRLHKDTLSSLSSHRSSRPKSPVREHHNPPPLTIERRNDPSSGTQVMIEQLMNELNLSKKKMAYLQKENEKLVGDLKKTEKIIETTVNEKLTIERARVKDSLKEYSAFIDKLLAEKKDLENKSESQAKLIKELCTRLDDIKELEQQLKKMNEEKHTFQNEYDKLCQEARQLYLEKKNMVPLPQYQEVLKERDTLKFELTEIRAKLKDLETRMIPQSREYDTLPQEQANQTDEPSFLSKLGVSSVQDLVRNQYNTYRSDNKNPMAQSVDNFKAPPGKFEVHYLPSGPQEIKSARARESPEFSFDARNGADVEFKEPFRLSVTLEDNYDSRKSPRKENKLHTSPSKPQTARGGRKDLELKNVEEDLNSDLDDLIANLNQRLKLAQEEDQAKKKTEEANEKRESFSRKDSQKENQREGKVVLGEAKSQSSLSTLGEEGTPRMAGKPKEDSADVKFGVLESLKKAENIFQKLNKTIPKSLN